MAKKLKTEHAGAKNGGGHWGKRVEAKTLSKKARRINSKKDIADQLSKKASDEKRWGEMADFYESDESLKFLENSATSVKIGGIKFTKHDSSKIFKNHTKTKLALVETLMDGDQESFVDILFAYVRTHTISEFSRRTGLSHKVINSAIKPNANPTLDTICKLMTAFKG